MEVLPVNLKTSVAFARLVSERGLHGEIRALQLSTFSHDVLKNAQVILALPSGQLETKKVISARGSRDSLLIQMEGIETPDEASSYRGAVLYLDKHRLPPLADDQYWHDQIIGMTVYTLDGRKVGTISDILGTGGNDVYVVDTDNGEVLIPAVRDIIRKVEIGKNRMEIDPLEGLLD